MKLLSFEQVASCHTAKTVDFSKIFNFNRPEKVSLWRKVFNLRTYGYDFMPRGWVYQNMVVHVRLMQKLIDSCDPAEEFISPHKMDSAMSEISAALDYSSPYKLLASIATPNFTRAFQTLARNQTLANEGQVACALERYHLAHAEYPDTLDMLMPQFIGKLPHDIIGGQPLRYRREANGQFILYSVGWNETDDGGVDSSQIKSARPFEQGDWVWKN
ncbi:MAG: hypothetical protein WDM76_10230 [Limisphaerales bacterium]